MSKSLVFISFQRIRSSKRLSQLITLISFLLAFIVIRTVTYLQLHDMIPNQDPDFLHIHHMVPGIILLLISGYLGLSFWSRNWVRLIMSALFGIGAALTLDEFALWLFLNDVYWAEQGRRSIDAVIITVIILSIMLVISEIHDHAFIKRLLSRRK